VKHHKILILIAMLLSISACRTGKIYLSQSQDEPIPAIPAGLDSSRVESFNPIPSIVQEGDSAPPYITPPGSVINPYAW
jgi:hypothetical protein